MRKSLILFLLICVASVAMAQEKVGGFIHVSAGLSTPQGDFGSSDASNARAGFAKGGPSLGVLLGHKIAGPFGMFGQFTNSFCLIDREGLANSLSGTGNYSWSSDMAAWRLTGFSFGPHLSFNLKRSAFDIRTSVGAMTYFSPELNLSGSSQTGGSDASLKQLSTRSSSWTLGVGLTYKYEVKWGFVLLANAEYLMGNPNFVDVQTELYLDGVGLISEQKSTYQQGFRMLNLELGCGWVF
ncbi:MAG: hypothetical protein EP332_07110 [Bacteroidetes bacterium]|nr:MAG: hypothetical protein EP332_07110 [Bacteroidota bacterium]